MEITISSVLGVDRLRISAAPIALLAGLNGAGKSSTIAAIGAALTGLPLPHGFTKKDGAQFVREGAQDGRVTVSIDGGKAVANWPSTEVRAEGVAPKASVFAAGISSLLDMGEKERAQTLAKYLKTDPTKADFAAAMRDSSCRFDGFGTKAPTVEECVAIRELGLDASEPREVAIFRITNSVWPLVEDHGFDGAHSLRAKAGAEFKGAWQQVAGGKYGPDKGANWTPEDYLLVGELVGDTPQDNQLSALEELVKTRNAAVDEALKASAISGAALADLKTKAADLPRLEREEAAAKKSMDKAREKSDAWSRKTYPPLPDDEPLHCPHCGCAVMLKDGKLVEVTGGQTAAEREAMLAARAEFERGKAADRAAFDTAYAAHKEAGNNVIAAKQAARKLEEMGTPKAGADVEAAKLRLSQAERAHTAFKAKAEADKLHKQIVANQAVLDILAPDGIRQTRLASVLEMFNDSRLLPLTASAGWQPVTIRPDMSIWFGTRPARAPFISESQLMRVRVVLQIAMAQLDGSDAVLIDRADMLDRKGRDGLFGLLARHEVRAVVGMTMNKPEQLPDLGAAGLGAAYWLEGGQARSRSEMVAPVAQAAE